uniref:ATP synthase F0 subunit 8 n=1 Tax=Placida sp. 1 NY-2013 TaxID=1281821 RepID=L7V0A7_9GAST|nr:ATP synthase F0 subunit 8 [Placida sp. 1 NY-2013]AGC56262.1 ATP synthase F0 subunit 8 [Placida sp. 1 NY-2013]
MMGIMVFLLTNLSFMVIVLSIRSSMNINAFKASVSAQAEKAFRGFS